MTPVYMKAAQAAMLTGTSEDWIRSLMANGTLSVHDLGRRMKLIKWEELESYIESCRVSGESSSTEESGSPQEDMDATNSAVCLVRIAESELKKRSAA